MSVFTDPPRVSVAMPVLTLLEGDSRMVTVTVDANPQATNALIRVDGSSPSTRITVDNSGVITSVVTFSMVNRADTGIYNFTSTNSISPSATAQIILEVNCKYLIELAVPSIN